MKLLVKDAYENPTKISFNLFQGSEIVRLKIDNDVYAVYRLFRLRDTRSVPLVSTDFS